MCLHNQLSSIHSIKECTDPWQMVHQKTVKMKGCSFQQVLWQKLRLVFVLTPENTFF